MSSLSFVACGCLVRAIALSRSNCVIVLGSKLLRSYQSMCACPRFLRLSSTIGTSYVLQNHVLIDILSKTCSITRQQKYKLYKPFKRYRALCARVSNKKSRKKRREPCSSILKNNKRKEERFSFPKPPKKVERRRCSVRQIHVRQKTTNQQTDAQILQATPEKELRFSR